MINYPEKIHNPNIECRLFADYFVSRYFNYLLEVEQVFGLGAGFDFSYNTLNMMRKGGSGPTVFVFGKSPSVLPRLTTNIGGQWFCEHNGTIADIRYILEHHNIPVIVDVNLALLYRHYPMITRIIVDQYLNRISEDEMDSPHQAVVVEVDDTSVHLIDNVNRHITKMSHEDFIKVWSMPNFLYQGQKKCYMEYSIIRDYEPEMFKKSLPVLCNSALVGVLQNMTYGQNRGGEQGTFVSGLEGLELLKDDVTCILERPTFSLSVNILSIFDKMYFDGLYRNMFASFVDFMLIPTLINRSNELRELSLLARQSALDWKKLIKELGLLSPLESKYSAIISQQIEQIQNSEQKIVSKIRACL